MNSEKMHNLKPIHVMWIEKLDMSWEIFPMGGRVSSLCKNGARAMYYLCTVKS